MFHAAQPNIVPSAEASSSTQEPSKSQTDTPNKSIVTPAQAYQINDFLVFAKRQGDGRQGDNKLGHMKCELMTMQLRLAEQTRDLIRRDEAAKKMADNLILDEVNDEFITPC